MITPHETNIVPREIATADDAVTAVFVKLEQAYQSRVWTDADEDLLRQQLGHYKPEWILSACDETIGEHEFYHISNLKKACEQYAYNERMANLYKGPDPFAEAFGVGDKPVDVNRKLLRVQLAWLHDQKAKGIDAPKKIPFNSPEHRILKERISEFDGVPVYQLADKVRQVLECE